MGLNFSAASEAHPANAKVNSRAMFKGFISMAAAGNVAFDKRNRQLILDSAMASPAVFIAYGIVVRHLGKNGQSGDIMMTFGEMGSFAEDLYMLRQRNIEPPPRHNTIMFYLVPVRAVTLSHLTRFHLACCLAFRLPKKTQYDHSATPNQLLNFYAIIIPRVLTWWGN
jgi:hypothetical protein